MNFTSDYNYKKAFDSGNSNNAQINDLEMKIKFDSTNFKNEDYTVNNNKSNNNNENNENSAHQKNNTMQNNLGIIDSLDINDSKSKAELRKKISDKRKKTEKQKLLKTLSKGNLSLKYKIFLITLWIVFLASFIIGFITHFEIKLPITASGIIWSFSFIIFIVALIYSRIFYRVSKSNDAEEKLRLLKNFPF